MATGSDPEVSVIVAACDVAPWIGESIASLKAQGLRDFEALIVDDGSRDSTAQVALAAIAGDARFRLIRQDNRGLSAARNTGLALARGRFVAFLDGDDAFAPGFLGQMTGACARHGSDWAACAITLVMDGAEAVHPGMHGATAPTVDTLFDLSDARAAVPLFPSAWNKVWRRSALGDLRFPEGLWFEDHEVFWRMARRAPRLPWLAQPLVRHRRGRPGQITGRDDERAFDLFPVLDRLRPVMAPMPGSGEAFDRLATRLIAERLQVLHEPARRARFVAAARGALAGFGARWDDTQDPEIPRALRSTLRGEVALSVVLLDGAASVDLPGVEVVRPVAGETAAALAARVTGRSVILLAPGEGLLPQGLDAMIDRAEATGAPMVQAGLVRETLGYHDGWCDNRVADVASGRVPLAGVQALRLYPALGNRLVRREVLPRIPLVLAPDAVSVQALVVQLAMAAGWAATLSQPVVTTPDRLAAPDLVLRIAAIEAPLPPGWRGVLALRLARLTGASLLPVLARTLWLGWVSAQTPLDPNTPRWLRRLLWLAIASRHRPRHKRAD